MCDLNRKLSIGICPGLQAVVGSRTVKLAVTAGLGTPVEKDTNSLRRIPNDSNASCLSDRSLLHKAGRVPAAFRLGFPLERAMVVGHAPDPRKHEIPTSS